MTPSKPFLRRASMLSLVLCISMNVSVSAESTGGTTILPQIPQPAPLSETGDATRAVPKIHASRRSSYSGKDNSPYVCGVIELLDQNGLKGSAVEACNRCLSMGVACQPVVLDNEEDSLLVGKKGCSIRADGQELTLYSGPLVAFAGKHQLVTVNAGLAAISIHADAVVILQVLELGALLRVSSLDGTGCTVTLDQEKRSFAVKAGEELVLAKPEIDAAIMVPADGVDREERLGDEEVPNLKLRRSKFYPKMMVERERLLFCNTGRFFYRPERNIFLLKGRIWKEVRPFPPANFAKALLE